MTKNNSRLYRRLDKSDRVAIENSLDKGLSCRQIAKDLGRSPSTISYEAGHYRTINRGPNKGGRVEDMPDDVCPKLLSWPRCCNGCKSRKICCNRSWRCEYLAARAQNLAEEELRNSRMGVDKTEDEFEYMINIIRSDMSRGISPEQIASCRSKLFHVSQSTIYRWISKGYAGMSNLDLRRKCGYKKRNHYVETKPTSHGQKRSYSAFLELSEEQRGSVCEMDTVMGLKSDRKCLLTLYLKPFKFQITLLMQDKTSASVCEIFDMLEKAMGDTFEQLFGLVLTDNGSEFANFEGIEQTTISNSSSRCRVFYCDVRQSQQKGSCERNHVEVRKILPKGKGISFDRLTKRDCSVLMSHLNSEPRPSLGGMCAIDMLLAATKDRGQNLLDVLGVKKVDYQNLEMSPKAIEQDRLARGDVPLIG